MNCSNAVILSRHLMTLLLERFRSTHPGHVFADDAAHAAIDQEEAERKLFAELWQDRVKRILIDQANHHEIVQIARLR